MSGHLRFALLGPVRAWRGDRELRLGPPQQQAVLAYLLLREGSAASSNEIIDALWTDEVPSSADHVIRTYVYRLRKILGMNESVEPAILSMSRGYLIRTGTDNLDLAAFRENVTTAQRASRAGDRAQAHALYDDALGLWSGTPLAGITGGFVDAQRQHLEVQRLTAVEAKTVEQIELGNYGDAEVALSRLSREHPLNERFRELRMLALYRHGRQSDALALFHQTQELLAEELGVDPGHRLRILHERILRADPALLPGRSIQTREVSDPSDSSPADESSGARPPDGGQDDPGGRHSRPSQLPADLRGFEGREEEMATADALVPSDGDAGTGVVVVTGMAGVGKTSFAVHWAHRVADRFPDGQIYLNLRGFDPGRPPLTATEAMSALFDSLNVRPENLSTDIDRQAAHLRSLVAGRRILFVFDNVLDVQQVRPLLPGGDGCLVIVTSRSQLRALAVMDGAKVIELDVLPADEAISLLAGRIGSTHSTADNAAMAAIVEWCGRLPLAIAIVAARVATTRQSALAEVLDQLRKEQNLFDALVDPDAVVDLRSVFSWSIKALSTPGADLFRMLAINRSFTWDEQAAASLLAVPVTVVRPMLAELVSANLIDAFSPGLYKYHDVVRLYANELAADLPPEDGRAAVHRLLDHFVITGQRAEARLNPNRRSIEPLNPQPGSVIQDFDELGEAWAWFVAHREPLLMAQRLAVEEGFDEHVWRISWVLQTYISRIGCYQQALDVELSALSALVRLKDSVLLARTHTSVGRIHTYLRQYDEAHEHLRTAVAMLLDNGTDPEAAASALLNLATLLFDLKEVDEATRAYEKVLDLTESDLLRAKALNGLARGYTAAGDRQRGLRTSFSAIQLASAIGDSYSEASAVDTMAHIHHELGHHHRAVRAYHRAVALFDRLGDDLNLAYTQWSMGDCLAEIRDRDGARVAWQSAFGILSRVDPPAAEEVRTRIGSLEAA